MQCRLRYRVALITVRSIKRHYGNRPYLQHDVRADHEPPCPNAVPVTPASRAIRAVSYRVVFGRQREPPRGPHPLPLPLQK